MSILLGAIGIANIGEWIYMIALHLLIFQETGSVLAVTAVYLLRPAAALLTNSWSGSLIDRLNQRNVMISLDITRALLIACIPFALFSGHLIILYVMVFFIQMAQAMFHLASMVYMTGLIPADNRKRFNAIRSLLQSGDFYLARGSRSALSHRDSCAFNLCKCDLPLDICFVNDVFTEFGQNRCCPKAVFPFNVKRGCKACSAF